MDYEQLYKRLWQAVAANDKAVAKDMQAFIRQFLLQLRAEGYDLSGPVEATLTEYLASVNNALNSAIAQALAISTGQTVTAGLLQSEEIKTAVRNAFEQRWPDGLTLSKRLWRWENDTRDGVEAALKAGVVAGKSQGKILYDMQRAIERAEAGQRFKIVEQNADDWVKELYESARTVLHTPEARAEWQKTLDEVREHIDGLKKTGTRYAAERVFSQIQTALEKGREDLMDNAVRWWTYDKQLYHLKRIARTEMATALHRAVIDDTVNDDTIIGYQWRLSASHPVADICDYYANIEMGLGKGVFSKDSVPRSKAHPHCMCLLVPRRTTIAQAGDKNYADFIRNTSNSVREQMLPEWAKHAMRDGVNLDRLIRTDGAGLISKKDAIAAGFLQDS